MVFSPDESDIVFCAFAMDGVGFIAALKTMGMPVVMPPRIPPALFVSDVTLPFKAVNGSLFLLPRDLAAAKPEPNSRPLTAGIKDFILEAVETAGPNPCPPMVIGVGIGGTFDKAALLAKKALMRPVDSSNPNPFYADLEKEMLEKVNELGIGPQGFGGKTTAIGLNIETLPTHIAGMPCAININCHVTRHKSEVI